MSDRDEGNFRTRVTYLSGHQKTFDDCFSILHTKVRICEGTDFLPREIMILDEDANELRGSDSSPDEVNSLWCEKDRSDPETWSMALEDFAKCGNALRASHCAEKMLTNFFDRAVKDFMAGRIHIVNAYIAAGIPARQLGLKLVACELDYLDIDIAHALLNAKVDVNFRDSNGKTPLYNASREGKIDVRVFLEAKAEVDLVNRHGRTPLYWSSFKGEIDAVHALLKAKANVNLADDSGRTPLHQSSSNGKIDVVRALLHAKANTNSLDVFGQTPLNLSKERGYTDVTNALLAHDAE